MFFVVVAAYNMCMCLLTRLYNTLGLATTTELTLCQELGRQKQSSSNLESSDKPEGQIYSIATA